MQNFIFILAIFSDQESFEFPKLMSGVKVLAGCLVWEIIAGIVIDS